jgi:hypothetical protein
MSNEFYPIGLLKSVRPQQMARVERDVFENGATSSALRWPRNYFKSQFRVQHAPLTPLEAEALYNFYNRMNGGYDSFWFRDNLDRTGNYQMRFESEWSPERVANLRNVTCDMEQVAPRKALLSPADIPAIIPAYGTPQLMIDANRQFWYQHLGAAISEPLLYETTRTYPVNLTYNLGTTMFQQWQEITLGGYGQSSSGWTNPFGANFTLIMVRIGAASTPFQVVLCLGTDGGAETCFGIGEQTGKVGAYRGNAVLVGPNSKVTQASGVQSIAFTFINNGAGAYQVKGYGNAALVGTDTTANLAMTAGPVTVGANSAGANVSAAAFGLLLHIPFGLDANGVKFVHNALAPMWGLAAVP